MSDELLAQIRAILLDDLNALKKELSSIRMLLAAILGALIAIGFKQYGWW
jgi:hypothetical protein